MEGGEDRASRNGQQVVVRTTWAMYVDINQTWRRARRNRINCTRRDESNSVKRSVELSSSWQACSVVVNLFQSPPPTLEPSEWSGVTGGERHRQTSRPAPSIRRLQPFQNPNVVQSWTGSRTAY